MLKNLYSAIREDAAPVITKIDGRDYSDKRIYPVNAPMPNALVVSTLTGLVDYLKSNTDKLENVFCHIVSPSQVELRSPLLPPFCDRACYMKAELDQITLPFNTWMDAEPFNIAMQAAFDDPDGLKATDKGLVLKFTSSVTSIVEAATSDDGVSQAVAVKAGITSKGVKELPNPVTLRPYRTFIEVEQPASKFIFRCRQEGGKMQFSLTEADGGAWRSEAMKNIKAFLEKEVPQLVVIA